MQAEYFVPRVPLSAHRCHKASRSHHKNVKEPRALPTVSWLGKAVIGA